MRNAEAAGRGGRGGGGAGEMRPFGGEGHAGEEAVEDEVEEGDEELWEVGDEDGLDDGGVAGAGECPALDERVGVERAEADAEEFGELVVLPV